MQHLCISPEGKKPSLVIVLYMSSLGKVLALHRIKPHAPPLVRAPVNSFEFSLAAVVLRRYTYRVSWGPERVETPKT